MGSEISREKICGLLKFFPSSISIRPAVLPQIIPRLTNQLKTNNKQSSIAYEKAHLTVPLTMRSKNLRGRWPMPTAKAAPYDDINSFTYLSNVSQCLASHGY